MADDKAQLKKVVLYNTSADQEHAALSGKHHVLNLDDPQIDLDALDAKDFALQDLMATMLYYYHGKSVVNHLLLPGSVECDCGWSCDIDSKGYQNKNAMIYIGRDEDIVWLEVYLQDYDEDDGELRFPDMDVSYKVDNRGVWTKEKSTLGWGWNLSFCARKWDITAEVIACHILPVLVKKVKSA